MAVTAGLYCVARQLPARRAHGRDARPERAFAARRDARLQGPYPHRQLPSIDLGIITHPDCHRLSIALANGQRRH